MSDHTPPRDEPLPDQSRARIREDLLRAAQEDASAARRWLVPAVAAAAVVLVAALGAWAVQGDGDPVGQPAAGRTSSAPSPPPLPPPDASISVETSRLPDLPDPTGMVRAGTGTCEEELVNVLPGAEQAVAFPADGGTTGVWVRGEKFSLCDVRGGVTTVHQPLPIDGAAGVAPLRVSTVLSRAQGGFEATRVAGGLVPGGMEEVFDLRYTFPDGHTEPATTVRDERGRTWWRMLYTYDIGSGSELERPPITATLSYSGVQKTYSLDWATDTCAQANHGC